MKIPSPLLYTLAATAAMVTASAQLAVPEPPPPDADQPPVVSNDAPLVSLDQQLGVAVFDQRGGFAPAYDEANRLVDAKVAELRARGLVFADEATTNLESARERARQAFRNLSLATEETWRTARSNALQALRRVEDALKDLEKTATIPQA